MQTNPVSSFDVMGFLTQQGPKRTSSKYQTDQVLIHKETRRILFFHIL